MKHHLTKTKAAYSAALPAVCMFFVAPLFSQETAEDWAERFGVQGAIRIISDFVGGPRISIKEVLDCTTVIFEMSGDCLGDVEWYWPNGKGTRQNPATYTFSEPGTYTVVVRSGNRVSSAEISVGEISTTIRGPLSVESDSSTPYEYFLAINGLEDSAPLPAGVTIDWAVSGGRIVSAASTTSRSVRVVWDNLCGNSLRATLRTTAGCSSTTEISPVGSGLRLTLNDINTCNDSETTVTALLETVNPIAKINWLLRDPSGNPTAGGIADRLNYTFNPVNGSTLTVTVRDVLGCELSATAKVSVDNNADAYIDIKNWFCKVKILEAINLETDDFEWILPGNIRSKRNVERHDFQTAGKHTVTLRVGNCYYHKDMTITEPNAKIVGDFAVNDSLMRIYGIESDYPEPILQVMWLPEGAISGPFALGPTQAAVWWRTSCGISRKLVAHVLFADYCVKVVEANLAPVQGFSFTLEDKIVCPNDTIVLSPVLRGAEGRQLRYIWNTNDGRSSHETEFSIQIYQDTDITLSIYDQHACIHHAVAKITVDGYRYYNPKQLSSASRYNNILTTAAQVATNEDGSFIVISSSNAHRYTNYANPDGWYQIYKVTPCEVIALSTSTDGKSLGNRNSFNPSVSADGNFVTFDTNATNITHPVVISPDSHNKNPTHSKIVRMNINTTWRDLISKDFRGLAVEGFDPFMSASGNFVAWASFSRGIDPNYPANILHAHPQVYVTDVATGRVRMVSVDLSNQPGRKSKNVPPNQFAGQAYMPKVSDDGRFVIFASDFDTLILNDNNNLTDLFLRDTLVGETIRIGTNIPTSLQQHYDISPDGRYVVFTSYDELLNNTTYPTRGAAQVYRFDMLHKSIILVSRSPIMPYTFVAGDADSGNPSVTRWGNVIFASRAGNLISTQTTYSNLEGVYFAEIPLNFPQARLRLLSTTTPPVPSSFGGSYLNHTAVSKDGRAAMWIANDPQLLPPVWNGQGSQVYRVPIR